MAWPQNANQTRQSRDGIWFEGQQRFDAALQALTTGGQRHAEALPSAVGGGGVGEAQHVALVSEVVRDDRRAATRAFGELPEGDRIDAPLGDQLRRLLRHPPAAGVVVDDPRHVPPGSTAPSPSSSPVLCGVF